MQRSPIGAPRQSAAVGIIQDAAPSGPVTHSHDVADRAHAEAVILESDRRFRTLTENAQDIILIFDKTGVLHFTTPAMERATGWRSEELLGTNGFDLIHPDDHGDAALGFQSLLGEPGSRARAEFRVRCKNGEWRWMESLMINLLAEPSVGGIVSHSRDVTERKAAERALAFAEARYHALIENSLDLVLVLDGHGEVTYASPSSERVLGYPPEALVGQSLRGLLHSEDAAHAVRHMEACYRGEGCEGAIQLRLQHRDGTWRLIECRGVNLTADPSIRGLVMFARDLTVLDTAARLVAYSEQLSRGVLDSVVSGIAVINGEGTIVAVNAAWRAFGEANGLESARACIGDNYLDVCRRASDCPEAAAALAGIEALLAGTSRRFELEYPCHAPNEQRWFLMHGTPLPDESPGAVLSHLNITERRATEARLRRALDTLSDLEQIVLRGPAVAFLCRADARWSVAYVSGNVAQFGYSAADLESGKMDYVDLIHPDDLARVVEEVTRWETSGQTDFRLEYRFLTASGEERWINDTTWVRQQTDGRTTHFQCLVIDVTDRHRAEAAFRETAENLQQLVEASPLPIIALDRQGCVSRWNTAAEAAFGWTSAETVGEPYGLVPAERAAEFESALRMALEGGAAAAYLSRRLTRDGRRLDVSVSQAPVFGVGGAISGIVEIIADVSESRLTHEFQSLREETGAELLKQIRPDILLQRICDRVVEISGLGLACFGLVRADGSVGLCGAAGPAEDNRSGIQARWDATPTTENPVALAIATGREQRRGREEGEVGHWAERAREFGLTEELALPLRGAKGTIGALAVCSVYGYPITEALANQLRSVADQIAVGMQRAEEQQQLKLNGLALNSAANAVFITDRAGRILWVNSAFSRLSGYPESEVIGNTPRVLKSGLHPKEYYESLWATILSGKPFRSEVADRHKNGQFYMVAQTVTPLLDAQGEVTHFVAIHEDITARREAEARVEFQAQHDSLTGLPNRALFRERLEQSLAAARRSGVSVQLLFMDLDHFKTVNDTLGHDAGDELLKEVARRCTETLRSTDLLARLGGDEFTVLLPEVRHSRSGAQVAEKLIDVLSPPITVRDRGIYVTPSIGISTFPADAATADDLIRAADSAMYRAKQSGRNRYHYFTQALDEEVQKRFEIENGLRVALEAGQFELLYQPQFELGTGKLFAVEALLRWRHPTKGLISPGEFIPVAEDVGLMTSLGDWVLQNACEQGVKWREQGLPPIVISVNVSLKQGRHRDLAAVFREIIQASGYDPQQLALELTEDALLEDPEETSRWIRDLQSLGVQFWIDDFGTGFSSLASLAKLPLDGLKIDLEFVSELGRDQRSDDLVRAIINLAHGLHLKVIAEGVETEFQRARLAADGCDFGQGYLWSRAITPEATELLHQSSASQAAAQAG